jgi:hypothetical protein
MGRETSGTLPPLADWPLFWFAEFEQAIERDDLHRAADAQQQLARLGVRVSIDLSRAKPPRGPYVE